MTILEKKPRDHGASHPPSAQARRAPSVPAVICNELLFQGNREAHLQEGESLAWWSLAGPSVPIPATKTSAPTAAEFLSKRSIWIAVLTHCSYGAQPSRIRDPEQHRVGLLRPRVGHDEEEADDRIGVSMGLGW
jgi:hypothetical protein